MKYKEYTMDYVPEIHSEQTSGLINMLDRFVETFERTEATTIADADMDEEPPLDDVREPGVHHVQLCEGHTVLVAISPCRFGSMRLIAEAHGRQNNNDPQVALDLLDKDGATFASGELTLHRHDDTKITWDGASLKGNEAVAYIASIIAQHQRR